MVNRIVVEERTIAKIGRGSVVGWARGNVLVSRASSWIEMGRGSSND